MSRMFQGSMTVTHYVPQWQETTDWELGSIISDIYETYVRKCLFIQPTDWKLSVTHMGQLFNNSTFNQPVNLGNFHQCPIKLQ